MSQSTKCPECSRPTHRQPDNAAYPFCSARCQRIDLGRWLGDEYVVSTDLSMFGTDREQLEAALRLFDDVQ
ncbi:MAG: DNA gyrase inhibitor YacG [Myxococcota bacterium]|nr:DNA gyrase inhibitor YacG [Myxococcota bacterium]